MSFDDIWLAFELGVYPVIGEGSSIRVRRYFLRDGIYPVIEFYDNNMIFFDVLGDGWSKVDPCEILRNPKTPVVDKTQFIKMLAVFGVKYPVEILALHDRFASKKFMRRSFPTAAAVHSLAIFLLIIFYWLAAQSNSLESIFVILASASLGVVTFLFLRLYSSIKSYQANQRKIIELEAKVGNELSETLEFFVLNPQKKDHYVQGCFDYESAEQSAENFRNTPQFKKLVKQLLKKKKD